MMTDIWIIIDGKWRHIVINDEIAYVDGQEAECKNSYLKIEDIVETMRDTEFERKCF